MLTVNNTHINNNPAPKISGHIARLHSPTYPHNHTAETAANTIKGDKTISHYKIGAGVSKPGQRSRA